MKKYKIAFITTEDYTSKRIIESIRKLGHKAVEIRPDEICVKVKDGDVSLIYQGKRLEVDGIMHKMSTDFRDGLACLEAVKDQYIIFNSAESVLKSADKFLSSVVFAKNRVPEPSSTFTQNNEEVLLAESEYGLPVVFKQPDGAEGMQVGLARVKSGVLKTLKKIRKRGNSVIEQEYIGESFGQDLRVIVAGGKIIAAMKRVQKDPTEFRANIHRGGVGEKVILTKRECDIAIEAAEAVGLDLAGVDILQSNRGPLVIETNSFPGLKGIEAATGIDVAGDIVRAFLRIISEKSQRITSHHT